MRAALIAAPPETSQRRSPAELVAKRLLDLTLGSVLFAELLPPTLAAAALVWLVDRHPPFFLDRRVGHCGRLFRCLKLRTLRGDDAFLEGYLAAHPEEARRYRLTRKLKNDPRKTRLGNFLRRASLDEAPQLLNVLAGQMSIVGPRPISPREFLERGMPAVDLTLVKPGLTGLWQVSGRSDLSPEERNAIDSFYAHDWSLRLDLSIIARTPIAVLTARGAN